MEILPVDYELESLLHDLYIMAQIRANEKNLTFSMEVDPEMPCRLYGDETRIRQILLNLLTNGIKYTPSGSVTFRIGYETAEKGGILLKASVTDTGIGMTKEQLSHLFENFFCANETATRNEEGTGRGMSISKRLVDMMGGTMEVESTVGVGSTFCVTIPQGVTSELLLDHRINLTTTNVAPSVTHALLHAPKAHILIVDDNELNLAVAAGLLEETDTLIDTEDNGADCLKMAAEKKYDLIFLDHIMPNMDGVEVLKRMNELPHNASAGAPVIVLTANAMTGVRAEYLRDGFTDYLAKPIDPVEIEQMLIRYLPEQLVTLG